MSEFAPKNSDPEHDRLEGLAQLAEYYIPDDKEFISEMDFEDALGYIYGCLLGEGLDPDEILKEFGVTE